MVSTSARNAGDPWFESRSWYDRFLYVNIHLFILMPVSCNSSNLLYIYIYIFLTTLLTSPVEFSLYFQNHVRHLNQNFREVRKIYKAVLRAQLCGPAGSVVEHPLRDREVVGSNLGCAIPKAFKMVPVATLLGAQHYKASTGFSSPDTYRTINFALLAKINKSEKSNNQCLYSPDDRMEDWQLC